MRGIEKYRALVERSPSVRNLLAAEFNQDWDLDHPDVESVYASTIDQLEGREGDVYLEEAKLLQQELGEDDSVKRYMRYVGTGLSPMLDLGMTPKQWLDALVARLERG
ncbi:contact-dependent growth inhibition system immunity protein [Curtobacterium sp. PhB136]|uniref:contact-dependent growth inhibition system immunity protein n=1 Tax=Curtobacterium sp. PhB136 TaxID=2485181 RepID=UPI0010526138|nr:contact-dependent growth inhibition system immunity protein [Curtobacterium sp. PhB136]TCK63851.1 hypothetical protein EDF27_2402 [Curtobacterium sp. PhB136]